MPRARAVAILVVLALIGTAGAVLAASVERPAWTTGDFWEYRTNTTLAPGLNLTGNATTTFAGVQATGVGGSAIDAYRLILAGAGVASGSVATQAGTVTVRGSWTLTGEERLEPTNLHPVYSLLDVSVNGTYEYGIPLPFSLRVQNTTTFQILSDGWAYPLAVGTAGNVTEAYNFTQDVYSATTGDLHANGTGMWTLGFSLAAAVTVATPAGTFAAYPVREVLPDGTWGVAYFSPDVGNDLRTESRDAGGNLTAVTTLVAYRYQVSEPTAFLGLTLIEWAILGPAAIAGLTVVILILRHNRRAKRPPSPGEAPSDDPTLGPRGP